MPALLIPLIRDRCKLFPFCIFFLLCLLFAAGTRGVVIQTIPTNPTDQDHVILRILDARPDGCWEFTGHECLPVDSHHMRINLYWVDEWEPGLACVSWAVDIEEFCGCGILEGGTYVVTVYKYGDSQRDPETYIQTFEFNVCSEIATSVDSWGKIKIIYR